MRDEGGELLMKGLATLVVAAVVGWFVYDTMTTHVVKHCAVGQRLSYSERTHEYRLEVYVCDDGCWWNTVQRTKSRGEALAICGGAAR
jgi:hypothetical protein